MTVKHSKGRGGKRVSAQKRRRSRKAIRCFGAMITPRRGLIFAQGRAIQQSIKETKVMMLSDDQTKSAVVETGLG